MGLNAPVCLLICLKWVGRLQLCQVCVCSWKRVSVPTGGTVHVCSTMQLSQRALCCPSSLWSLPILQTSSPSCRRNPSLCSSALSVVKGRALQSPALSPLALSSSKGFSGFRPASPSAQGAFGAGWVLWGRGTAQVVLVLALISMPGMAKLFFLLPLSQDSCLFLN